MSGERRVAPGRADGGGAGPGTTDRAPGTGGSRHAAGTAVPRHAAVGAAVRARAADLRALSHRIHAHPELAFAEHRAAGWCAELLAGAGFAVTGGAWGLPTAFDARRGGGRTTVAFCAEYDALPGVGHACGHNLIAAAAVGAGLALADVADAAGLTVRVVGTPAEESGGGKAHLLDAGAFAGVDAAMMVHAGPQEVVAFASFAHRALAARFVGARADAAAEAVSALVDGLDARVPAGGRLRTTERPWGLDAAPAHLRPALPARGGPARWVHVEARADDEATLAGLTDALRGVLRAAADEAGCAVDVVDAEPPYRPFRTAPALAAAYGRHAAALGRPLPAAPGPFAMTDMGNVSHAVPAIHPMLALGDGTVVPHDPAFADLVVTPQADAAILDAATALARTALDVAAGRVG